MPIFKTAEEGAHYENKQKNNCSAAGSPAVDGIFHAAVGCSFTAVHYIQQADFVLDTEIVRQDRCLCGSRSEDENGRLYRLFDG